MDNFLGFCVDGPIPATPVLCPALYTHIVTDAILEPVWPITCTGMVLCEMSLYKLVTFGEEVAMTTCCALADGEMWMGLTPVLASLEEVWVRKAKRIHVCHQFPAVGRRGAVLFGKMSRHPDTVRLQSVFAARTDQSWLGTVQYQPKLAQLSCEVRLVQEAPSILRVVRH
jgi:hypothetical protein